ncbi:hypothetical protein ABK040_007854 [Willaertia magna]
MANFFNNAVLMIIGSFLSVYFTKYATKKVRDIDRFIKENPLFLVWGILNILRGKSFTDGLKRITQEETMFGPKYRHEFSKTLHLPFSTEPLNSIRNVFFKRKQIEEVKDNKAIPVETNFEEIDDSTLIDEDIYYLKRNYPIVQSDDISESIQNIQSLISHSASTLNKIKQYITAEDIILQQQHLNNQNTQTPFYYRGYTKPRNETVLVNPSL